MTDLIDHSIIEIKEAENNIMMIIETIDMKVIETIDQKVP
jgi:hypothetical protein